MNFDEELDFSMSDEEIQLYRDMVLCDYLIISANKKDFVRIDEISDSKKVKKLYEILDLFVIEGVDEEKTREIESLIDVLTIKVLINKDISPLSDI